VSVHIEIMVKTKKALVAILLIALVGAGIYFSSSSESDEITGGTILSTYNKLSPQAKALYYKQSEQLTKPVDERIVELDELNIGCFGPSNIMKMSPSDTNLGGQCCGALKDAKGYELQLEAIGEFIKIHGDIKLIPTDPYDMTVEHAQLLTSFDKEITLTSAQQSIYDEAMENSHHGGPCCCKCWKWYVMSGLAKKVIVDHDFVAEDVSELWDISSSCGHAEDTNFYEHYDSIERDHDH